MSTHTSWFAVDGQGRVAVFDVGELGARPAGALKLDEIHPSSARGWWLDGENPAIVRFEHVVESAGGHYRRTGGEGTLLLETLPEPLHEHIGAISIPADLAQVEALDLRALLPEEELIEREPEPPEGTNPLEFKELFQYIGPRIPLKRQKTTSDGPVVTEDGGAPPADEDQDN